MGILILLCALAPIVIGLLMPGKKREPEHSAPATTQPGGQASDSFDQPGVAEPSEPSLDLSRFDARARVKQRDALRRKEAPEALVAAKAGEWARLLELHKEGSQEAFQKFLDEIAPENALQATATARRIGLSQADRSRLYEVLGRRGGGDLVRKLIDSSDRDAALAVKGWSQIDPAGALDWFRQMDVRNDPALQRYLADGNLLTEGFLDTVSAGLLDSMQSAPNAADADSANPAFADAATRLMESLMAEDPKKGEAMMRELTERFVESYPTEALTDWFNQLEDPNVQSAAIQRIIETGAFKDNPFQAVDVALSLDDPKSRGNALSAAFGQLGGGAGGVDPNSIAAQLNAMPAGRERDFAINGYAHGLVGKSPEAALEWAGSISDEGFREIVVRNVSRRVGAQAGSGGR
jgi:hypothetical protein